jgi:hypothetical protein
MASIFPHKQESFKAKRFFSKSESFKKYLIKADGFPVIRKLQ